MKECLISLETKLLDLLFHTYICISIIFYEQFKDCQQFIFRFRESMPCEQLVSSLCDLKQAYTQYGGKRPFGVSILYMGWDSHHGYQLYHSDPAGMNYFQTS